MIQAESHWHIRISIGVGCRSNEYLLINTSGLYKCRSMKRMSRDKAFNGESQKGATFGLEVHIKHSSRTTFEPHQGELTQAREDGGKIFIPRRTKSILENFVKAGFTDGCKGCAWLPDRVGGRVGHSEYCRNRVEEHSRQSDGGMEKLQRAQGRIDMWCSEEIKKSDVATVPRECQRRQIRRRSRWHEGCAGDRDIPDLCRDIRVV